MPILMPKIVLKDLIIEYLIYKITNGFGTNFTLNELKQFLKFLEKQNCNFMLTADFEKQISKFVNENSSNNEHFCFSYCKEINDYVISADYDLNPSDLSNLSIYYWNKEQIDYLHNLMHDYLIRNEALAIMKKNDNRIRLKKSEKIASIFVNIVWNSYIEQLIKKSLWPKQCKDISKYLLEFDLAKVIGVDSIKTKLLKMYKDLTERIYLLYNNDENLKISTDCNQYLAYFNYQYIVGEYAAFFHQMFGLHKNALFIDVASSIMTIDYSQKPKDNFSIDSRNIVKKLEKKY